MAGRQTEKFLSPAHFKVISNKSKAKPAHFAEEQKLLPPNVYKKGKSAGNVAKEERDSENLRVAKEEIDKLQTDVKVLKEQFDKSRVQIQVPEKDNSQRNIKNLDEVKNVHKLDEIEAENDMLLSENRKQQAIISKLRNDMKQVKMDYMSETAKLDDEIATYTATIRQLKQDLKENYSKYDTDLDSTKELLKKEKSITKELTLELEKLHEQIKSERSNFEDVISEHATLKYQDVKSLQEKLKCYKSKYLDDIGTLEACIKEKQNIINTLQEDLNEKEMEIKRVKEENVEKENEFDKKINECQVRIESRQEKFDSVNNELNKQLQEALKSHDAGMKEFQEKLDLKDRDMTEAQKTIEQLRTYIGENLPNIQLERLQNENIQLKQNQETLLKENCNMNSTIQFMNIRMTSMNEILSLQENELSKMLPSQKNPADNLLTKWRKKVFALLVNLKSNEISQDNDKNKNKQEVLALQAKCNTLERDIEILAHTLTDKNAQIQIEINKTEALEKDVFEKEKHSKELESSLRDHRHALASLYENSLNVLPFMDSLNSNMEKAFSRLSSLSQRVSFATGRVQFLQDTEPRKELLDEITRLTSERDMLAGRALKDSQLLECRVENIRTEYETKVQDAENIIERFENELREEKERSVALKDEMADLEAELKETNENLENLKMDLARHDSDADKKLSKVMSEKQEMFTEQITDLEKQLQAVRTEHTKTLVTLRQAEHQLTREKDKTAEQLTLQQKDFDMKLEQLEKKARNLEQERNMLMTTIRQEGVVVSRSQPKSYHPAGQLVETAETRTVDANAKSINEHEEQSIANALQDLKFLSEALLNMNDEQ